MAAKESTPSPEKKPLLGLIPVQTFDWGDVAELDEIKLHGVGPGEDSSSDEDIEEKETIHSLNSQQANTPDESVDQSPTAESMAEQVHHRSKSPSQVGEKSVNSAQSASSSKDTKRKQSYLWPVKFLKRGKRQSVASKLPTKSNSPRSISLPPPNLSETSRRSPVRAVVQQMAGAVARNFFSKSDRTVGLKQKVVHYSPSINLATITEQDKVPTEVRS